MKKLYALLFVAATLFSRYGHGQSWGYAHEGIWVQDIAEATDGSLFACGGWSPDPLLLYDDRFVGKLSSSGELLWDNTTVSLSADFGTAVNVLPQSDGGCIVFCMETYGHPAAYRLDNTGALVWETSSWSSLTAFSYLYYGAAVQLTDGTIVTAGLCDDLRYHITEIADDGSFIAYHELVADSSVFAFSYYDYKETGLVATPDGGFALSAGKTGYKTLYKFNSTFDVEWNAEYAYDTDAYWEYGMYNNGLRLTSDGGYLMAGSSAGDTYYYSASLRKISADGTLEWEHLYNHGSITEEGAHALQLNTDEYILWSQNAGDNSTNGYVLDLSGNEIDSIAIPLFSCWGSGMEIWDVEQSASGGYYISGRQYKEDCSQRFTIIKSEADGSLPPCIFNCVWPGDANNDGTDDGTDIFEVGIYYGATGFTRDDTGIDWSPKMSHFWYTPDSTYWYILNDIKYADANGDGLISDDDTSAIYANLSLTHPLNDTRINGDGAPLYFAPSSDVLHTGYNEIPIVLGDDIAAVDAIYGITFTVHAEGTSIIPASLHVTFPDSWLATSVNKLSVSKTDADNSLVVSAIVRKDRNNTSGSGQIGTLGVVVIDNISGKTGADEITLSFSDVHAVKLDRTEVAVTPQSITFPVIEAVDDHSATAVNIYPNPAIGNTVTVEAGNAAKGAELSDVTGRIIRTYTADEILSGPISIAGIAPGNYFLKVDTGNGIANRKLIII